MLRDMPPGVDPLGPDNQLMFMTSVINGLPLSGANRYSAAGKSPLTGGFGEAEAGGFWGPEFKRTGFDGVILHGRAAKPVYLFVHDNQVEFRDASKYWGQLAGEVQDGLIDELGDKRICVLQTGVGGENKVLYAAITNQLRHFHGRAGLGRRHGQQEPEGDCGHAAANRCDRKIATAPAGVFQWFRDNYDHEIRWHAPAWHGRRHRVPGPGRHPADAQFPPRFLRVCQGHFGHHDVQHDSGGQGNLLLVQCGVQA